MQAVPLQQAESGELQSFVYSAEVVGGHIQSGHTRLNNLYEVVGQLERLKFRLFRHHE